MGQLPSLSNFIEKNEKFSKDSLAFRIDTVEQFDQWYNSINEKIKQKSKKSKIAYVNMDNIFRGTGEAKHKLLTSSQRFWISNELEQWWSPKHYLEFIKVFVDNARSKLLFNKIFEYYRLKPNQRDFPILSILQHCGAPTPLMDWSYNLDVALFFATKKAITSNSNYDIDHYFRFIRLIKRNKEGMNSITY